MVGAAALLLSGCGALAPTQPAPSPGRPVATTVGPGTGTVLDRRLDPAVLSLSFKDAQGRSLTLASLRGRTVVVTDFLTTCQEICPMTSANLRAAAVASERAGLGDAVTFLEVTVDPERDGVPRLAAYQALYGAAPNWRLLTSDPRTVASLWQALGVAYARTPSKPPLPRDWLTGAPLTYDVVHQDAVFLIDGAGRERWLVIGNPDAAGTALPARLDGFLNEEGRQNLTAPGEASWTASDVERAVQWSLAEAAVEPETVTGAP